MQPVVLAWALLFVVAFAIVYRFFSWLGRRFGQRPSAVEAPHEAKENLRETAAAPVARAQVQATPPPSPSVIPPQAPAPLVTSGEPIVEIRKPVSAAPPPPLPVTVAPSAASPTEPPAPVSASVAASGATLANPPRPAPASHYALPQSSAKAGPSSVNETIPAAATPAQIIAAAARPGGSSAVMSARAAAAAAAAMAMRAYPGRTVLAPSVAATLAPPPADTAAAPINAIPAAPPAPTPAPEVAAVSTPVAPVVASSHPAAATNGSASASSPPATAQEAIPQGSGILRAWRIGAEFPSLDVRLKDSRSRKTLPAPKANRKPPELTGAKEMKVLAQRAAPKKTPARRIGQKVEEENVLASAKAQTRIVGVPQRAPRVLSVISV